MTMADYVTELKNILNKINRQTWTEIKMLENRIGNSVEAGQKEIETLNKAKDAFTLITEILEKI